MTHRAPITLILTVLLSFGVHAATDDAEIQYLLSEIGSSDCTFTRNGTNHTAIQAEDHLRMKYRRAGHRISTADAFIERLASKSSWTGKPYLIHCGTHPPQRSGDWLRDRLSEYHKTIPGE